MNNPSVFKKEIFDLLNKGVFEFQNGENLYIQIESINVEETVSEDDAYPRVDIFVVFKLSNDKSLIKKDLLQLSKIPSKQTNNHQFRLTPGTKVIGEQRLCYTFSSDESLKQNREDFQSFILQQCFFPKKTSKRIENTGFAKHVVPVLNALTPELDKIYDEAKYYSLNDWKNLQKSLIMAGGTAFTAVPGSHLAGVTAEVAILINRMSTCSYGVGSIIGHKAGKGNILESEDFLIVLAKWAGIDDINNATITKIASDLVVNGGHKQVAKLLAKAVCLHTGILIGGKINEKVEAKLKGKVLARLIGGFAMGFVPIFGALIGNGINLRIIDEITRVSEEWYNYKVSL